MIQYCHEELGTTFEAIAKEAQPALVQLAIEMMEGDR